VLAQEDFFNDLGKEINEWEREEKRGGGAKAKTLWEELEVIGEELVDFLEDVSGVKVSQYDVLTWSVLVGQGSLLRVACRAGVAAARQSGRGLPPAGCVTRAGQAGVRAFLSTTCKRTANAPGCRRRRRIRPAARRRRMA
jgi:hypothetical protein